MQEMIDSGDIVRAVKLVRVGDDAVALAANQFRYDADTRTLTWSHDAFAGTTQSLSDGYYQFQLYRRPRSSSSRRAWSLSDGYYQFQLYARLITDEAGNPLAGDSVQRTDFHCLAGEVTGQAAVTEETVKAVNAAVGTRAGSPGWNPDFDVDGDGIVTARDRLAVARARGNKLPPR